MATKAVTSRNRLFNDRLQLWTHGKAMPSDYDWRHAYRKRCLHFRRPESTTPSPSHVGLAKRKVMKKKRAAPAGTCKLATKEWLFRFVCITLPYFDVCAPSFSFSFSYGTVWCSVHCGYNEKTPQCALISHFTLETNLTRKLVSLLLFFPPFLLYHTTPHTTVMASWGISFHRQPYMVNPSLVSSLHLISSNKKNEKKMKRFPNAFNNKKYMDTTTTTPGPRHWWWPFYSFLLACIFLFSSFSFY